MPAQLHLSAALNDATDAFRLTGQDTDTGTSGQSDAYWTRLVRLAEQGGLDFVTLTRPGGPEQLDAFSILARAAEETSRIGLVPAITTLPGPLPTLAPTAARFTTDGRAGWLLQPSFPSDDESTGAADAPVTQPWNGWAADVRGADRAEGYAPGGTTRSRHAPTPRRAASSPATGLRDTALTAPLPSWRAALTTPTRHRAQRQRPPLAVPLDLHGPDELWPLAARHADIVLLDADHPAAAKVSRTALKRYTEEAGRDPAALRVLVRLAIDVTRGKRPALPSPADTMRFAGTATDLGEVLVEWHATGVADGFHLLPTHAATDLFAVVHGLVPRLRAHGVLRTGYRGRTLRDHLPLAG
jgi:alkanesulfonate monooxygenase SsuD/methylene tetrahydromethanopterin reductase-like flavin-dependent oxidoreductase (luciferase family)